MASSDDRFSASNVARQAVYGPEHVRQPESVGAPGAYPFTRGLHPLGHRARLWTMRQYAGFATAAESNRRYRYLLESGQTGLSVAFDLPTQIGYDSDDPHALGEVGRVGVAIDSLEDMELLLDGLPLERISTSMTINATAMTLLALYVAVARRRGIPEAQLSGTVQNDVLKEYVARGTYIYPPRPSLRLVTDLFAYCHAHVPRWNTISISGYHIREAGATAPQEIAFTFAHALEYVRAARAAGLDPERFGERLSFFFACHSDFIEEVAKFRAARRLWARLCRERLGIVNAKAQHLRFHVQTGGVTLTAQQPDNNVVRVALQALAAVLGGCQSLHTNAKDEALALPTEASALLALRTQQVIAYESGWPIRSIHWVGRGLWRRPPRRSNGRRSSCSRPSNSAAARCAPSSAARSSARSRSRPTPGNGRSRPGGASSWASTASPTSTRRRPPASRASIRASSATRSSACGRCARVVTPAPGRPRCKRSPSARAAART